MECKLLDETIIETLKQREPIKKWITCRSPSRLLIIFIIGLMMTIYYVIYQYSTTNTSTSSSSRRRLLLHTSTSFKCWMDYNEYYKKEPETFDFSPTAIPPDFESVISNFLETLQTNRDFQTAILYHTSICHLQLDTDDYKWYQSLHSAMAVQYPKESARPIIELTLKNLHITETKSIHEQYSFGIIGGVGQLADAEVLNRLMDIIGTLSESLQREIKQNMVIYIHSNPPPRGGVADMLLMAYKHGVNLGAANLGVLGCAMAHYSAQISYFLQNYGIDAYLLASNTAHLNYKKIQIFDAMNTNPFHGVRTYINVIEGTVNMVAHGPYGNTKSHINKKDIKVLIIGTTQAYDAKLYKTALKAAGIRGVDVSKEKQENIQAGIDFIKAGEMNEAREIIIYDNDLCDDIKKATHVLMGCSELSMAVTKEEVQNCSNTVLYIDTTELMAVYIAEWLIGQQWAQNYIQKWFL